MFIIGVHVVYCTKRKLIITIIGIGFLTFAAFLLGFSLIFYLNYVSMAERFRQEGYSLCDGCPLILDAAISGSRSFGIAGGLFGAIGAWLTITGLKSKRIETLEP